jgi:hypothetical protein
MYRLAASSLRPTPSTPTSTRNLGLSPHFTLSGICGDLVPSHLGQN